MNKIKEELYDDMYRYCLTPKELSIVQDNCDKLAIYYLNKYLEYK